LTISIRQIRIGEIDVPGGRKLRLELAADGGERIPAILLLPEGDVGTPSGSTVNSRPAALLLHGYTSRKERMADTVGAALLQRKVTSLAIDFPMHGDREGDLFAQRSPMQLATQWRTALAECELALGYRGARAELDRDRLGIVGYSLGAFLGITVAASHRRVRALVLAAGGDFPVGMPFEPVLRAFANPLKAARQYGGRPLLMVNGRNDRTVRPDQAERLFAAAGEPKEMRWWNCGHVLPTEAIADGCDWLAERLGGATAASP